jgi:hypothetical protein
MSILKRVPKYKSSWDGFNARPQFFMDNANSEKYYYMPVGDNEGDRNRNTLVPLGTFLGFISFDRDIPINGDEITNQTNYGMRFSNPPYNNGSQNGAVHMSTEPLVYTDHPPGAGSVPLHYYDYVQMNSPEAFDENGRPKPDAALPGAFGDGENGNGGRTFRPPGYETEQLRNSRLGAQNFVAKKGGNKTRNRKNRKSKKSRNHKKRTGRK